MPHATHTNSPRLTTTTQHKLDSNSEDSSLFLDSNCKGFDSSAIHDSSFATFPLCDSREFPCRGFSRFLQLGFFRDFHFLPPMTHRFCLLPQPPAPPPKRARFPCRGFPWCSTGGGFTGWWCVLKVPYRTLTVRPSPKLLHAVPIRTLTQTHIL